MAVFGCASVTLNVYFWVFGQRKASQPANADDLSSGETSTLGLSLLDVLRDLHNLDSSALLRPLRWSKSIQHEKQILRRRIRHLSG